MIAATFVLTLSIAASAQGPGGGSPPDSAAYRDPAARRLVALARARRETVDRSIAAYQVTMRERIGAGIRALRRDRTLYRRELALRIDWRRDGVGRIDVLGARQVIPAARADAELPDDLKGDVADYAFDPADDRMSVSLGEGDSGRQVVSHPLARGSEADYRFASGDSSVLAFQGGGTIRLRELRVTPRRLEFRLVAGSLWIDEGSGAVVRALFRPSRPWDFDHDVRDLGDGEGSDDDVPGFLKPIRVEVRFLTIDYALWHGRWWLPRLIAFDGVATAGTWLQMPMRYERRYDDYEITGDTAAPRAPRVATAPGVSDSAARAECKTQGDVECVCRGGKCRAFEVHIPSDTTALVANPLLPPAFNDMGGNGKDSLITTGELEQLTRSVGHLPAAPWQMRARLPRWGLMRYNRVEGLSLGARAGLDFGRVALDGSARIASSDGALDLEGGLVRDATTQRLRLAGYRRLAGVDPAARSLGFGNSLAALLLGRDDGDYYRATGVELTGAPSVTAAQSYGWRLYAERQRGALKRTDFSLAHTFDKEDVFRPNIAADSADQVGAAVAFHAQRGFDPEAPRWGADVALDGGAGTFGFGRASAVVRFAAPLTARLAGAVEVAAGMSAGRVPVQSRWYLGGPNSLRGYGGGVQSGDAFWRARIEVANRFPAARLVLFTDVGRAGPRDRLSWQHPLIGAGLGASMLDGLVRMDLGRALRRPTGWRLDFYLDAAL